MALLGKWKWRMLSEGGLWRKVIGLRYGEAVSHGNVLGASNMMGEFYVVEG